MRTGAEALRAVRPQISAALAARDLDGAVEIVDRTLLVDHLGVRASNVRWLRAARRLLFERRAARGAP